MVGYKFIGFASTGEKVYCPMAEYITELDKAIEYQNKNGNIGLLNSPQEEARVQMWYKYGF